jgi:TM2 domain-containing membrane protein YozV
MAVQGSGGNVLAATCSFFIPGLGQLVQGRILPAILFFVAMAISWGLVLILVGYILVPIVYLWCIIDAARYKSGD